MPADLRWEGAMPATCGRGPCPRLVARMAASNSWLS